MADVVALDNSLKETVNNSAMSSDSEDDIVIRRQRKNYAPISHDEEEERHSTQEAIDINEKEFCHTREITSPIDGKNKNIVTDDNDQLLNQLSTDCPNTVEALIDPSSIAHMNSLENSHDKDLWSKGVNNSNAISTIKNVSQEEKPGQNPKRFSKIIDSDSEDESSFNPLIHKKASPSNEEPHDTHSSRSGSELSIHRKDDDNVESDNNSQLVMRSESEDEESNVHLQESRRKNILKPNKISSLIDTDSEEDTPPTCSFGESPNDGNPSTKPNVMRKKEKPVKNQRTGSIRSAKEEAMREIRSETQRMLRESEVDLPYHRPKQRTLKEFLSRKKDLPMLPKTLTTAAKVKMSGKLVGKVLEEKEIEAELFYKSSSDSDHEEVVKAQSPICNIKSDSEFAEKELKNVSMIEKTRKITQNNLRINQSVKEVIKQGDKNLGVPRKLFISSENEFEEANCMLSVTKDGSEVPIKGNLDFNQIHKESKQDSSNISIPKNLFGSECDEPTEISILQSTTNQTSDDAIIKIQEISETKNKQYEFPNESDQFGKDGVTHVLVKHPAVEMNKSTEANIENVELKVSEELDKMTNAETSSHDVVIPKSGIIEFGAITEISKSNGEQGVKASSFETKTFHNNKDYEDKNRPIGHVYGLPLPDFEVNTTRKNESLIVPDIMRLTPRLQGSPDMVIDLSPPKVGVNKLLKRFLNHSVIKNVQSSPEVTAICAEQTENGMKITQEILPYTTTNSDKNQNSDLDLNKPGAKLMRLKKELQQQMTMRRTKEWEDKEMEMKKLDTDDDMYHNELSDCEMDDEDEVEENKEKEEEEEEGEEEEEEEEEEELGSEEEDNETEEEAEACNLPVRKQKNKLYNSFINAEAEVSEEEDEMCDKVDCTDVDSNKSFIETGDEEERESSETESQKKKPKKLKRIMKAFDDEDSNDSEAGNLSTNASQAGDSSQYKRTQTDVDMFVTNNNSDNDSLSGLEGDLPVYQQRTDERSQCCATPSAANNSLSIVSPITQLTALNTGSQSVNIDSKLSQNPLQSIASPFLETTPTEAKFHRECSSTKLEKLQKKLFDDIKQTPNDKELISLCSGQFSENPSDDMELNGLLHTDRKTSVSDAELLDLCSGTFTTQPLDTKRLEAGREKLQDSPKGLNSNSFRSPDKPSKEHTQLDISARTCRIVFSSDEEDEAPNLQVKNKSNRKNKRKVKILQLSDDESGKCNSDDGNLSDIGDEEVDYDSEENEIVVQKKEMRKAAARFLDEEAELSESEWGSADEDEQDLDRLDIEEGDLEDIDQDQVKKQLEKMHMRQILDEDQRKVRLLQEILLDDGDLHSDSAGRQRKFKWKNIDELKEDTQVQTENVDEGAASLEPNEAESELEWRKHRLERDQFLNEQRMKEAADNVEKGIEDSELIQLGLRALKRKKNSKLLNKDTSQSLSTQKTQTSVTRHTVADLFTSPGSAKNTFALQNAIHRGSFLARGEESLARLSLITKQNSDQAIVRTKKSRNFVFAHLSPAIETLAESDKELDDETNAETPKEKSRKRKPTFNQTPIASKKSKTGNDLSKSRNKLFN